MNLRGSLTSKACLQLRRDCASCPHAPLRPVLRRCISIIGLRLVPALHPGVRPSRWRWLLAASAVLGAGRPAGAPLAARPPRVRPARLGGHAAPGPVLVAVRADAAARPGAAGGLARRPGCRRPGVAPSAPRGARCWRWPLTALGFSTRGAPRASSACDVPHRRACRRPARLRIVQISDIHVGPTIKADYLQAHRRPRERAASPTWSPITGDLVDGPVPELAPHVAPLARPARAARQLLRHRQPRVLRRRARLDGASCGGWACACCTTSTWCSRAAARTLVLAGVTDYIGAPLRPRAPQRPGRGAARRAGRCRRARAAGAPAAQRGGGGAGRLRPADLRPHARRPVLALDLLRAAAAAVHGRAAPARPAARSTSAVAPATGARPSGSARHPKSRELRLVGR